MVCGECEDTHEMRHRGKCVLKGTPWDHDTEREYMTCPDEDGLRDCDLCVKEGNHVRCERCPEDAIHAHGMCYSPEDGG